MKATHKQSCADCGHYFWYGEMVFHSKYGYRNFICQKCAKKENESMKCRDCGRTFNDGDIVIYANRGCYCTSRKCVEKENYTCGDCVFFRSTWLCDEHRLTKSKDDPVNNCPNFERKSMPNIKITAEVNGKQVPLETISTETFEAIKALEKSKEIPAVSIGNFPNVLGDRRLFLKINTSIKEAVKRGAKMIAIELEHGQVTKTWETLDYGFGWSDGVKYENIQPL